ncbi:MAG: serine O-acetyltransferase [Bifidobacteriaceae bacterium]|jgi:serine O-acetyltransferase|nr:serine O-acetyltransferase [Bifidobacteriaceae bacterium]
MKTFLKFVGLLLALDLLIVKIFRTDISKVQNSDPAATDSKFAIALLYPGMQSLWMYRLSHRLWESAGAGGKFLARLIAHLARFFTGIEIHPAAKIGRRVVIDHGLGTVIGSTATIGDDCLIYHGVTLGNRRPEPGIRHPQVGNSVVIGAGAILLGPIKIGDRAKIGAGAIVLDDVPADTTYVSPARPLIRLNNDR